MAINATTAWRIRGSGNAANGGGYDAGISGAATDYTDQDAAQLTITDGATSGAGSTTLTSAAAGFTSAMIGNCIRVSAGTNFQTGYYFVTAFGSSTSVTLDRTPTSGGAGSGGNGKLGGAFAHIGLSLANGGGGTQPTITTPLAAGHTIYIRGSNNDDSPDYIWTGGYWQFPAGDTTSGAIHLMGYNVRPCILCDALILYSLGTWKIEGIQFRNNNTTNNNNGTIYGLIPTVTVTNCIFDQAGLDVYGVHGVNAINCYFRNSGVTTAGTSPCLDSCPIVIGTIIRDWRGYAVTATSLDCVYMDSIIANCHATGNAAVEIGITTSFTCVLQNLTIDGNASSGIKLTSVGAIANTAIRNCILSNNGAYGLDYSVGTTALNDRTVTMPADYNDFYNNTTAARHNISAGAHDLALNPQYTNTGSADYSIGTNLKAAGFPGAFLAVSTTTTSYVDMGGAQRAEASGGGIAFIPNLDAT